MIPLYDIKTIILDYDGTLHNSIYLYAPAFRNAYQYLVDKGLAQERQWTDSEISYWLGFSPPDMWKHFLPDLEDEYKTHCSNLISRTMQQQIVKGKAKLYEGALDTLAYLKAKGYHMIFLSNCKQYYLDSHINQFSLDQYFTTLLCSEQFDFRPKYEIVQEVKNSFPDQMIIIGDRVQDMEAGKRNHIRTIGCRYGFGFEGELNDADIIIDDIRELRDYL